MFHPFLKLDEIILYQELLPTEADELDLELAAHSDRWLFERPPQSRTLTLTVPPQPPSKAVLEAISVVDEPESDFFRGYRPTRWHGSPAPPGPPVDRWWRTAHDPGAHGLAYDPNNMKFAPYSELG